jgi:hypothetical protein
VGLIAESEGQLRRERAVELEGDEPMATACEYLGDGSFARADLDNGAVAEIAESVDDGVTGGVVHKKVLAQLRFAVHMHPMSSGLSAALV